MRQEPGGCLWLYSALGLCWGHPALPRDTAVPWALRVLVLDVDIPGLGTQDFSTAFPCASTQECTDGSAARPLSPEQSQQHAAGLKNPVAEQR